MDQELTIEQRLQQAGLGHRRMKNSVNTGRHEVYVIATGEVLGEFAALESLKQIDRLKLAESLIPHAVAFHGEEYGDSPTDSEVIDFATKFAACELTGYVPEDFALDAGPVTYRRNLK